MIKLLPLLLLTSCAVMVEPDLKNSEAVATYNNQIFQIITAWTTGALSIIGIVGLYIRSLMDAKRADAQRERDKAELAALTKLAAAQLATEAQRMAEVMLREVRETKSEVKETRAVNAQALNAANHQNDKIMKLQEQVVAQTKRGPSRSTDNENVQKVEITTGPGVDEPLKVAEEKR